MKKSKNLTTAIMVCGFVFVAALVAFILLKMFEPHETRTSNTDTTTTIAGLSCTIVDPSDAFFHAANAKSELHEVKITMKDDVADKVSFTYTGTFPSEDDAKTASADLHADYNTYMGTTTVNFSDLLPNFSVIDNQVVIALFLDKSNLTVGTAPLIFLPESGVSNFAKSSLADLEKIYTKKGFTCKSTN